MYLSDSELLALLHDNESERAERKAIFSRETRDSARISVCSFANDLAQYNAPGVLFIGVHDSGEASNIRITDELLLSLSDMKTDGNILPQPVISVQKRNLNGADMAVVTVMPSDMPPVRYKGRVWVRTGPRNSIASEQEERMLSEKRRSKHIFFDLQAVPLASIADFSRATFEDEYLPRAFAPEILEANHRTYEQILASTRMIVSVDEPVPTVLGILALGKKPRNFIPAAYIQFIRLQGRELSDPVMGAEEISGTLLKVRDSLESLISSYNIVGYEIGEGSKHILHKMYPPEAILQIVYNAIMHRSYEGTNSPVRINWFNDRIEVISPGGPYGRVNANNFGQIGYTDYRNPNLAAVMRDLDYVQQFGRGIFIAQRAMQHNGNPPIEFSVDANFIICTLYRKKHQYALD